jgi:hypothetical protein
MSAAAPISISVFAVVCAWAPPHNLKIVGIICFPQQRGTDLFCAFWGEIQRIPVYLQYYMFTWQGTSCLLHHGKTCFVSCRRAHFEHLTVNHQVDQAAPGGRGCLLHVRHVQVSRQTHF